MDSIGVEINSQILNLLKVDVNFVDGEIQYYFTLNGGKVYKGLLS